MHSFHQTQYDTHRKLTNWPSIEAMVFVDFVTKIPFNIWSNRWMNFHWKRSFCASKNWNFLFTSKLTTHASTSTRRDSFLNSSFIIIGVRFSWIMDVFPLRQILESHFSSPAAHCCIDNVQVNRTNVVFKYLWQTSKSTIQIPVAEGERGAFPLDFDALQTHHQRKALQPPFFINSAVARVVGALPLSLHCVMLLMVKLVCVYSGGKFIFSSVRKRS